METLTGSGFWDFGCAFFEGKKHRHDTTNVIASEPGRARQSRSAFTLAEVLITLVIIGVIAALTIPNLMQKYTEQATVKKVQKFYSNLSNAYTLAMKENGPENEWGLNITGNTDENATKVYEILFKPYFKIGKNCGITNTGNCIADITYKMLNNEDGINYGSSTSHAYKIALDDGASVVFNRNSVNSFVPISACYDTNGIKEPNQWGIDFFCFVIKNEKVIPYGLPEMAAYLQFNNNCKRTGNGTGCAAWVVYKGNMDYLHCNGLTWKSRSCKDK